MYEEYGIILQGITVVTFTMKCKQDHIHVCYNYFLLEAKFVIQWVSKCVPNYGDHSWVMGTLLTNT